MAHSTHIEGLTLSELLRIIANSRLSGVATVINGWKTGRIVFVWGRVVHASADGQERLGQSLVRKGLIAQNELDRALEVQEQHKKKRPLGTILSGLGHCQKKTIQLEIAEQMKSSFFEVMAWEDAVIHFLIDEDCAASLMVHAGLDTQALLLEMARAEDEARMAAAAPEASHDVVAEAAPVPRGEPVLVIPPPSGVGAEQPGSTAIRQEQPSQPVAPGDDVEEISFS